MPTDVGHWRQRAEELRASAARMLDADTKTLFLKMADEYDRLAERAAEREHSDRDGDHRSGD